MSPRPTTYRFGPIERRGILGPVTVGQALTAAGGGLASVATLDLAPSATGLLLAVGILACAVLAAVVPLGGRSLTAWLPVVVAFASRRAIGGAGLRGTRWRGNGGSTELGIPDEGFTVSPWGTAGASWRAPRARPPAGLGDVRIVRTEYRGREVGALVEDSGRRLTAILACRVGSFALLDAETQARRLARWGNVLAAAAGTPIRRISWIERTAPAPGDELARWLHAERDPEVPLRGTPMIDSYLELISSSTRVTQEHEILLSVQVDAQRSRGRSSEPELRTLLEHTERIAHGVEAAEVVVIGALGPRQIARTLRTAFDPFARAELAAFDAGDPDRSGLSERNAWPLGVREGWDRIQTDGAVHATFWISAWPRIEVSPMFLGPLLGRSSAVRTVAVVFEPLAVARSTRDVEAAVTRDLADRTLRARFGQAETARQRQAADATRRREAELAAGHAEVRLAGYVTVSGRDEDELQRACDDVLENAARARLELHRLYGHQGDALQFTLPLCRGLR
jgi:hypothetical protein